MVRTFSEYVELRDHQEYELLKAQILREVAEAGTATAATPATPGAEGEAPPSTGGLSSEDVDKGLDAIKLTMDAWGFEQFTGWIGDLISGTISAGQALWKWFRKKPEEAKGHGMDAAISLVSAIPFGDVAKLLKLRHGPKYARAFIKAAKPVKQAAGAAKAQRFTQKTGQYGLPTSSKAQQMQQKYGSPPAWLGQQQQPAAAPVATAV